MKSILRLQKTLWCRRTMVRAYATPEDVESKQKTLGREFTNADIQGELESAHRKLETEIGRYYIDRRTLKMGDTDKTTFEAEHSQMISFEKINHNGEVIDDSHYEVDLTKGEVAFDEEYEFRAGDTLIFFYTPTIFRDLEVWYAIEQIFQVVSVESDDEVKNAKLENIKNKINNLESRIKSKGKAIRMIDGQPWRTYY